MKRKLASGVTAILLAATMISAPESAAAQQRYHDQGRYHERYDRGDQQGRARWDSGDRYRSHRGDAVAAGVAGLVIGAILGGALSSQRDHRYDHRGYYGDGDGDGYDYGDGDRGYGSYGYDGRPRTCITRQQRWDDYQGEYVWVEQAYPC